MLFGADGVVHGLKPGKIVVDMSTISPLATKDFARRIEELGCFYIDSPVSGGEVGAKAGTLTLMVGGREEIFERVKPLLQLMGKTITLIGGNGDGQTAKAANQIIVALNIEAVAEALLFASKAGADPAKVRQALLGGFAQSAILEVHGERMLKRTFAPGFRIALHAKDLAIVLAGARALQVPLPNTAHCQELFNASFAAGEGGLDELGSGQSAGAPCQPRNQSRGLNRKDVVMVGPPGPRGARPEDKLHDPTTQCARVGGRERRYGIRRPNGA